MSAFGVAERPVCPSFFSFFMYDLPPRQGLFYIPGGTRSACFFFPFGPSFTKMAAAV